MAGETTVAEVTALDISKALVKEIVGSVNRTPGRGERHNVCVWQKWHGYWQYYLLVLSWTSLNGTVLWGPFLERPGIFSGLKVNFKIKTCWIVAQFLAHKPVKNYWNFVRKCKHGKHKTAFRGPKRYRDFRETGPRSFTKRSVKSKVIIGYFFS